MAVIRQLKNFFTNKIIYPKTLTKAVYDEGGERLDKILRDTMLATDNEEYSGVEPRDSDTLGGKYKSTDIDTLLNRIKELEAENEKLNSNLANKVDTTTYTADNNSIKNNTLGGLCYLGGSCGVFYQSANQLGESIDLSGRNIANIISGVVSINYFAEHASAQSKISRIVIDITNPNGLSIFAYSDDNLFISSDRVRVSWFIAYTKTS